MAQYQPSLGVRETAKNINYFLDAHKGLMKDLYLKVLPYILVFYGLDALVSYLYFPNSENGFVLGSFFAAYFQTAFIISWHRVVIQGPDRFSGMNPFRPQKSEFSFILMGFVVILVPSVFIFIAAVVGAFVGGLGASPMFKGLGVLIFLAVFVYSIFLFFRWSLYFPAKAAGAHIRLRDSFRLSRGLVSKFLFVPFVVLWKQMLFFFLYVFILGSVFSVFLLSDGTGVHWLAIFVAQLPIFIYFQPIFLAAVVTSLSNYYLYAVQNSRDAVLSS